MAQGDQLAGFEVVALVAEVAGEFGPAVHADHLVEFLRAHPGHRVQGPLARAAAVELQGLGLENLVLKSLQGPLQQLFGRGAGVDLGRDASDGPKIALDALPLVLRDAPQGLEHVPTRGTHPTPLADIDAKGHGGGDLL